ncbi:metallophosphoesterase [Subsaxibacter sp. CAU 1640]|uniref:metallophosphoesterase n=1 Tax=Subsaxibacter sp. CAU 1640 TaxID=2933271 RepID=UPI002004AB92|nr:metallophosphoesterase [Subsaxibacter sp. CAU 1640]MCK7589016.1 metallophosphoesterase [Subsaxibacter sp. CAU 1640]
MKTFAIGDIHGGLRGLEELIKLLKLGDNDRLIFLGDYVDGWSESAQVIDYLMQLSKRYDCIFIKGNHDAWCEDWLRTARAEPVWLNHGGKRTIESYSGFSEDEKKEHLEFFERMKMYHLDNENRLFLHAGFTSMHGITQEVSKSTFYYDRTLWEMALTMDKRIEKNSELYPKRLMHYDEIFIGHTPTLNFNSTEPMNAINVWNVDTGAAFFGKLSGINIDSKEVFQTQTLMELYPNERGRNQLSLKEILAEKP